MITISNLAMQFGAASGTSCGIPSQFIDLVERCDALLLLLVSFLCGIGQCVLVVNGIANPRRDAANISLRLLNLRIGPAKDSRDSRVKGVRHVD